MGDQIIFQFGQDRAVGVVELQPVGNSHGGDVALLERALTGGTEVGGIVDGGAKMTIPSHTGVFHKFKSLFGFPLQFLFVLLS